MLGTNENALIVSAIP